MRLDQSRVLRERLIAEMLAGARAELIDQRHWMPLISLLAVAGVLIRLDKPVSISRVIGAASFGPLGFAFSYFVVVAIAHWPQYLELRGDKLRMGGYYGCTDRVDRITGLIIKP